MGAPFGAPLFVCRVRCLATRAKKRPRFVSEAGPHDAREEAGRYSSISPKGRGCGEVSSGRSVLRRRK